MASVSVVPYLSTPPARGSWSRGSDILHMHMYSNVIVVDLLVLLLGIKVYCARNQIQVHDGDVSPDSFPTSEKDAGHETTIL